MTTDTIHRPIPTLAVTAVLLLMLFLSACGGKGGNNTNPSPPANSSNWDEMIWDQDNWA